jgi:hypothetical protein
VPENIQVTLSSNRIVLDPGGRAEVTATIQNTGNVVEVFSIEVGGIEPDWYSLSASNVSLFPGDKDQIRIVLTPPLASASKAGSYTVSVKASSNRDPTVMTIVQMSLDIGVVSSYELDLTPKKIRARKGSYQVVITNMGNITNTFKLEASDPAEDCNYDFKSDTVVVEPGATVEVPLAVNPKKKPFTGAAKSFSFAVKAIPVASEVRTVQGQLECPPLLPKWAIFAIAGGLVAIIVIIVLVVVLTGGGGGIVLPLNESFQLGPGDCKIYEVQISEGTIKAEAEWSSGPDSLSLVLYGSGKGKPLALARDETIDDDNPRTRTISYPITAEHVAEGGSWRIYIANLDNDNEAAGGNITIRISG